MLAGEVEEGGVEAAAALHAHLAVAHEQAQPVASAELRDTNGQVVGNALLTAVGAGLFGVAQLLSLAFAVWSVTTAG